MQELTPSEYQLEQRQKFFEVVGYEINTDDFDETLQNDEAFEIWDNIATDEYERQGGEFNELDPNQPSNPKLFEDCQTYATLLLTDIS